nr:MAG TPA: hypothetical protein [Caudoviricetes sp.]
MYHCYKITYAVIGFRDIICFVLLVQPYYRFGIPNCQYGFPNFFDWSVSLWK